MAPHKVFEHTADVGLEVRSPDITGLFTDAALGLVDLITDLEKILAEKDRLLLGFTLKAENREELFLKWMRELLFNFSAKRLLVVEFKFEKLGEKELDVRCGAVPYDPDVFEQRYEVKAVTYHNFEMKKNKSGWTARVILDI